MMKNSIFWSKGFIPVYFIIAVIHFVVFKVIIDTNNYSIYIFTLILLGLGIASILYNNKSEDS